MAKEQVAFELENPNGFVTQASQIGMGGQAVDAVLSRHERGIESSAGLLASEDGGSLDIADEEGFSIIRCQRGHIKTKNFDSEKDGQISVSSSQNSDLDFADLRGYIAMQLRDGHVKTKKFDSRKLATLQNLDMLDDDSANDFVIGDVQGNVILQVRKGHIRTKNFDSAFGYIGKRCSILGDSISTYGVPGATNTLGTYTYAGNMCRYSQNGNDSIMFDVNDTWWMRVINDLGMVLGVNESWRGTTVSTARGVSNSFSNQGRINHLGRNGTPDLIIVYGGTNDAGAGVELGTFNTENPINYSSAQIAALPATTFADAYRTMLIRLLKTYPHAEIVAVLPNFCTSYYTITNLDDYVEIAREACDFFGIKWIDIRTAGINIYNLSSYLVDGIHPNAKGMMALAEKIKKQLLFT